MYFSLPNIINPVYMQQLGEMIPPPSQNTVGVCNQVTLLILYYISSRLVPPLKLIGTPIQVSGILVLTVCFKFINFSFQIFLLFFLRWTKYCVNVMRTYVCSKRGSADLFAFFLFFFWGGGVNFMDHSPSWEGQTFFPSQNKLCLCGTLQS
jgi:hypothetical protein